jgi:nucleoside triphosphate diphosphatase
MHKRVVALSIERLLEIMVRLRDPRQGCPWDRQQGFASIAPYTIEEAYEVAEAIACGEMDALRQELGDLLFQVVFYAQLAQEQGLFDFQGVVAGICDKMERRHPHVFADAQIGCAEEQHRAWERMKHQERHAKALPSVLDDVALALPALTRAQKLQKRAARVGFDWPDVAGVRAKVLEELEELSQALEANGVGSEPVAAELGDLLFSCVNLARHAGVNAEESLRGANRRFEARFRYMETELAGCGESVQGAGAEMLESLWQQAKGKEGSGVGTSDRALQSDDQ